MSIFTLILWLGMADPVEVVLNFKVGPVDEDMRLVLLEAILNSVPPGGSPILRDAEKREIPSQLLQDEVWERLVWLAPHLKKGESPQWELTWKIAQGESKVGRVRLEKEKDGSVSIYFGKELFSQYRFGDQEQKPFLYPINLGATCLTRHYPMKLDVEGEKKDHPHQCSLWFTHGDVNGVDFWAATKNAGRIVHKEFTRVESGPVLGRLGTRCEWIAPDGKKLLDDAREYRFIPLSESAIALDLTAVLTAAEGPVTFGDTKEGSFGIRLAESMKEERGGRIENSRGQVGEGKAWGKPAEWVDYTGTIAGKTFGAAILDHPESFRHPTHWHVRAYGLFAANPFGYRDFYNDKSKDGSYRLEKGQGMKFRYRVIFHAGTTGESHIDEIYRGFASPPEIKN